ncbi:hypothetical protein, partial [Vibrio genomosp. F10]|uniref:hypothetical protein n=1 Tax=Vibrio genomosp. F10 TaxID=723171 RepID=UPI0011122941
PEPEPEPEPGPTAVPNEFGTPQDDDWFIDDELDSPKIEAESVLANEALAEELPEPVDDFEVPDVEFGGELSDEVLNETEASEEVEAKDADTLETIEAQETQVPE